MSLEAIARKICDAFTYDPGHSDLDNEQPIALHITLGDWRRLDYELSRVQPEAGRAAVIEECIKAMIDSGVYSTAAYYFEQLLRELQATPKSLLAQQAHETLDIMEQAMANNSSEPQGDR